MMPRSELPVSSWRFSAVPSYLRSRLPSSMPALSVSPSSFRSSASPSSPGTAGAVQSSKHCPGVVTFQSLTVLSVERNILIASIMIVATCSPLTARGYCYLVE